MNNKIKAILTITALVSTVAAATFCICKKKKKSAPTTI